MSANPVIAGVHFLPALVWGSLAADAWRFVFVRRPRGRFFVLLALTSSLWALHYALHVLLELTPTELDGRAPGLHAALQMMIGVSVVFSMAVLRHMVPLLPVREEPPGRAWLAVNYGSALVAVAIVILPTVVPGAFGRAGFVVVLVEVGYSLGMGALALLDLRRLARRGAWRAGVIELSSPDVVILGVVLLGATALMAVWLASGARMSIASAWALFFHTAIGLGLAVPFAVRILGEMIRVLLTAVSTGAIVTVAVGLHVAGGRLASAEARLLVDLAALLGLVLALGPGRAWRRAWIDRLVFRWGRHRRVELQAFLHTLSPELGVVECCRRALGELIRVMQIPGAAILLAGDGGEVACGSIDPAPLRGAWRRDGTVDPAPRGTPFVLTSELPPPLRTAAIEAGVSWMVPIRSPRRFWGDLLATEAFVAAHFTAEDLEALAAFVAQLGLLLDGAELLARAVAVERSLAHSEKLAAIGELAARIAHDIRNPVTAARSLAQQLCRDPAAPFTTEHALILEELERVERHVAALLRFARREEFRFEPVDLGELVRGTVETLRPRLEAAGVGVDLALGPEVVARADREKMRHVFLNVVENALDALGDAAVTRRVTVVVDSVDGHATVRVADTGPGVPADALPHLFEPFFSLKPAGTGLGLAIAKRTVDAHGGRISAASPPGAGMTIAIELPLAGRA